MRQWFWVLAALSAAVVFPVRAHTVTVDGNPADWPLTTATQGNLGHICRGAGPIGEYIWIDVQGDERTDFASPDTRVDLLEFRATADSYALYFLARMADIPDNPTGDGAVQIQVAIDLVPGGQTWMAGFSDTQVDPAVAWEYLVFTRFGSGSLTVGVWDANFTSVSNGGPEVISSTNEVIEFSVPWYVLDMVQSAPVFARMTVATFRSNTNDNTWDVGGPTVSNALDVITNYGDPGLVTANTWAEVSDQIVNYYYQIHLEWEPGPPVVVTHVLYDPWGNEPAREFIRIYNRRNTTFDLSADGINGYKIGDEETIHQGEGMKRFPSPALIENGMFRTIASSALQVSAGYGITCHFEFANPDDDAAVPNLTTYGTWATGTVSLSNTGDEVLLLDGCDTVVDVVVYEGGSYAGVTSQTYNCQQDELIYRMPPSQDTDNCAVDFSWITVPVELVSFVATPSNRGVLLTWETASESDNLGFNLYRSPESSEASPREKLNADLIPGAGTTQEPQRYSFLDERVEAGRTYAYWLEQVDVGGNATLYGPVVASVPAATPHLLTLEVAPVPASDAVSLLLEVPVAGRVRVGLFDLTGRLVAQVFDGSLPSGRHALPCARGSLPSGVYLARAQTASGWVSAKVVLR